jgi:hypothetical protein
VTLQHARDISSGQLAANREFQVWVGQFVPNSFFGPLHGFIGTITTDSNGSYSGPILSSGSPFSFAGKGPFAVQFVINTPDVRSEMVSGIVVR